MRASGEAMAGAVGVVARRETGQLRPREALNGAGPGAQAETFRAPGLTRLRLFFIGWVVVYHLELALRAVAGIPVAEPAVLKGYLGVDAFFVLSGFALWLGYGARPPKAAVAIGRFLARRLARIWPLHVASLLGLAGLVAAAQAAGFTINDPERFAAHEFWLQLFLVNAWETTDQLAWNYPSWALSAIFAGYLAFPLLVRITSRLPRSALALLPLPLLASLAMLADVRPGAQLNLTVHLGLLRFGLEFVLGLALGRLCAEGHVRAPAALMAVALLPLGLWLRLDVVVVAGLAALIAATFLYSDQGRDGQPRDMLHRLGEASFGVYLCWIFIEAALVALLRMLEPDQPARLALMVAGLAANLAAGWLAWRLVEVPANRFILARLR